MENILKTRYYFIRNEINNLYKDLNINGYPIKPLDIIDGISNAKAISYKDFADDNNFSYIEIIRMCKSKEGCCYYKKSKNQYLILYNNCCNSYGRVAWTIIHELGHIVCNHYHMIFPPDFSEKYIYDFQEREANFFASQFLAHPSILKKLNLTSSYELEVFCGLSKEAAQNRYRSFLNYDLKHNNILSDQTILDNFENYLLEKQEDYLINKRFIQSFGFNMG